MSHTPFFPFAPVDNIVKVISERQFSTCTVGMTKALADCQANMDVGDSSSIDGIHAPSNKVRKEEINNVPIVTPSIGPSNTVLLPDGDKGPTTITSSSCTQTSDEGKSLTANHNTNLNFSSGTDLRDSPSRFPDKKKDKTFMQREVTVKNPQEVDQRALLLSLRTRFHLNWQMWTKRAARFEIANLIVTILVIFMQVSQVIIFQVDEISIPAKHSLATILPSITSGILAMQLKLAWSDKVMKGKTNAKLYKRLLDHVEYRLSMIEAGGKFVDATKMWNAALLSEVTEVPAFLPLY